MDRTVRIMPIDELPDFRVVEGDPDVRGWEVLSGDGRTIGEVNNLLVDVDAMKVRYLDVDIDNTVVDTEPNRHILIPVGYARVDEASDRVFVDALEATAVPGLPEYRDEVITREYENSLRVHFDHGFTAPGGPLEEQRDDFYSSDLYSSDRFYETRRALRRGDLLPGEKREDALVQRGGYRSDHAPAFADSGSYGAHAAVNPAGFGPEIVRDGEIREHSPLDGLGQLQEPRGPISALGHFGSGWSDDEIVRTQLQRTDGERIRGL